MTYIAYYNPHSPDFPICLESIFSREELGSIHTHILKHRQVTRYNYYCKPYTIVVKSQNLLIFELPYTLDTLVFLRTILSDLWQRGLLHTFHYSDYPELLL